MFVSELDLGNLAAGSVDFGGGALAAGKRACFVLDRSSGGDHSWSELFGDYDWHPAGVTVDVFLAELEGAGGTTVGSKLFGDAADQYGDAVFAGATTGHISILAHGPGPSNSAAPTCRKRATSSMWLSSSPEEGLDQ